MTIRNNLPSVSELESLKPKIITSIYSDKGEVIKEFAEERRIEVPYAKIPEILIKAIIATEDPRFYSHKGVDTRGDPPGRQRGRHQARPRFPAPAPGREHDHPAAGPLPVPLFPADHPAQAQGDVPGPPDREASTPRKRSWSSTATSSTSATASTGWRRLPTSSSARAFRT